MQNELTMKTTAATGIGSSIDASRSNAAVAAGCAALLGIFLLWGVGFSHIEVFHNVAHDTRHSNAFPCH